MTGPLRIFAIGGVMSYRALFNWQSPGYFVTTMLGHPVFQILFFAYLGRFAEVRDDAYFVVGNAIQVAAMAGVYGVSMTVGGERWTQTLTVLLATPANRVALFLGRAVPHIAMGFVVSAFGFAVGWAVLDFDLAPASVPALGLVTFVTAASATGFGLVSGAFGLRLRDVFLVANPVYFSMLLLCGVNVPLEALPGWLEAVGRCLPMTHGIEAAREVASGATLSDVSHLVWTEAAIGLAYAVAAYFFLRFFEEEGRRRASLEQL